MWRVVFKKNSDSNIEIYKDGYTDEQSAINDRDMLIANGFWFDVNGNYHSGLYYCEVESY